MKALSDFSAKYITVSTLLKGQEKGAYPWKLRFGQSFPHDER